jgi:hypothetical protein
MRTKKTYTIDVDYEYGPVETYTVEAYTLSEAKKKAKSLFVKDYFRKSYLKCSEV